MLTDNKFQSLFNRDIQDNQDINAKKLFSPWFSILSLLILFIPIIFAFTVLPDQI